VNTNGEPNGEIVMLKALLGTRSNVVQIENQQKEVARAVLMNRVAQVLQQSSERTSKYASFAPPRYVS
jgi:hypothetical protein